MSDDVNEAAVQRVVSNVLYASEIFRLRDETKSWGRKEFEYALRRLPYQIPDRAEEMRPVYETLSREYEERQIRDTTESANTARHKQVLASLEELKTPHWSIVPNFWMTVGILILTIIGTVAAVLALRR